MQTVNLVSGLYLDGFYKLGIKNAFKITNKLYLKYYYQSLIFKHKTLNERS